MTAVGWVDDRVTVRKSISKILSRHLPKAWEVLSIHPLPDVEDYPSWIAENDVAVLILDERLHEQANGALAVQYEGHDIVELVRTIYPELPIFIITAATNTPELDARLGSVEAVVRRGEFRKRHAEYVARFERAANRYASNHRSKLARMAELATRAVDTPLETGEREELAALRQYLGLSLHDGTSGDLDEVVRRADSILDRIEAELEALAAEDDDEAVSGSKRRTT